MIETNWWSQRFAPEGSVAAEGIVKQLGRPEMDPLTVMVREAAQNSWDARRDTGPIDFCVSLFRLGLLADAWRATLLPLPVPTPQNVLGDVLNEEAFLLVISDRNTVGLGGPIRAGSRPAEGEKPDFVQFMRNVGEPRDHEHGGGTYGFGKGIFYRLSRAGTILVDTHTAETPSSRRLMAAALGDSYYVEDQRFTGRHWWGAVGDVVADPLLDSDAAAVSARLGLPGFNELESGTDIVIVAADLGTVGGEPDSPQRDVDAAAEYIASSILWHLWPKLVPDGDGRYMRFRVTADGTEVPIPSPESVDDLRSFVGALGEVREGRGTRYSRTVPPKEAGAFSLKLAPAKAISAPSLVDLARPFAGPPHHVARMRTPELVVDYYEGAPHSDARLAYGAVFKASLEADAAFAASEPPTHDGWIARGLTGSTKGVVQNLTRFLNREIGQIISPRVAARGETSHGLGELSSRLGALIPSGTLLAGANGSSNGSSSGSAHSRGGSRSGSGSSLAGGLGSRNSARKARITGVPRLEIHKGMPRVVAQVVIPNSDVMRKIRGGIDVVVEGGRTEDDPPLGADVPTIIEWRSNDGMQVVEGPILTVQAAGPTEWSIHASYVEDAVVRFRLSPIEGDGARHAQ